MKSEADGAVRLSTESATGRVGFVRTASGDLLPSVDAGSAKGAAAKADAYLDEYAGAFGARPAELEQSAVRKTLGGWTVEYTQSHRGVPVFAAELRAHVDAQGDLTAVNGFAAPDLDVDVTPRLTEADAATKARRIVEAAPSGAARGDVDVTGVKAASTELMVYRMGSTRGVEGEAVLAWVVEVTNEDDVRESVILDALTGKPVNRWSMINHALDRELYEADDNGTPANLDDDTRTLAWSEGDPFPAGLDADQSSEVRGAGETYWMFQNTFGYDSYDGDGATMVTVNNDPSINCPNASWNGTSTNYCSGVSSDDTVAHEWGHAYTEYTSGLVYQWQSGAMNEAYSDIWGETVDMLNDRQNTPSEQVRRVEGDCSAETPARISVQITAPASVAGPCRAVPAAGGPAFTTQVLTPQVVVGTDSALSGSTTDGCSAFTNATAIAGNWVYVDENFGATGCSYTSQGQRAEDAGAAGIIVGSDPRYAPYDMGSATFDIPALQVDGESGGRFKTAGTSTARITASTTPDDPSARWLSGEDDPAFGGAIRDMWNPTCYGDPGKVSDAEYHCDTSDGGGVHTNSGVVNHAFALMVDGSTYNGVQVPAIGLDKAAHLFWRAQSEYLTPTSGFPELDDALAASCTDLVGQQVNRVTLGQSATGGSAATPAKTDAFTTADCAAADSATQAVELAKEPVQCNFGPLLAKGAPSLCGKGFVSDATWSEDFSDGLAGWTQDEEVVYLGASSIPWEASTSAPGGHRGGVAFAPDPRTGSCNRDAADVSSRNGLISPAVTYPAGTGAKLSFDHYVATEVGYDGANVKVSVDGGAFEIVPTAAYLFNAPGAELESAAADNTNPMAGERAYTGTDGNEPGGSWGTSIVDLGAIPGADPGDELRFRFDMGRDGCGGLDGWYVDNVSVTVCEKVAASRTRAHAVPRTIVKGGVFRAAVKVTTPGDKRATARAAAAGGKVQIIFRGKVLATGKLNRAGRVLIKVTRTDRLKPGTRTLTASYLGSRTVAPSKDTFRLKVIKKRGAQQY
ncbi:M4 family metallopeptidase [Nocardioides dongkuii]|uniref:M4 family metallopeptidase n=1 Tax=Nocardioides dongkuii TaxID=2760089 RepID=UPI0015FCC454|nr:M4 family metallopeptidase [Nocardioides dongkuii]